MAETSVAVLRRHDYLDHFPQISVTPACITYRALLDAGQLLSRHDWPRRIGLSASLYFLVGSQSRTYRRDYERAPFPHDDAQDIASDDAAVIDLGLPPGA